PAREVAGRQPAAVRAQPQDRLTRASSPQSDDLRFVVRPPHGDDAVGGDAGERGAVGAETEILYPALEVRLQSGHGFPRLQVPYPNRVGGVAGEPLAVGAELEAANTIFRPLQGDHFPPGVGAPDTDLAVRITARQLFAVGAETDSTESPF